MNTLRSGLLVFVLAAAFPAVAWVEPDAEPDADAAATPSPPRATAANRT
jgi:hypothetical protein